MLVACFVGKYRGTNYAFSVDGETEKELIQKAKSMAISSGIKKKVVWTCLWRCGHAVRKKRRKKGSG